MLKGDYFSAIRRLHHELSKWVKLENDMQNSRMEKAFRVVVIESEMRSSGGVRWDWGSRFSTDWFTRFVVLAAWKPGD
jgi:hypothetical protein